MCINLAPKPPKIKPATPPPLVKAPPTPPKKVPDAKPIKKEADVAKVEYGTAGKKAGAAAARTGTDSLRIPLNTGGDTAAGTGGLNV